MAATLKRIGTIESDEEVEVCEESDDENTTVVGFLSTHSNDCILGLHL